MMCLMRDENERERDVIVMEDDVDEMNNTCLVLLLGNMIDVIMWCDVSERDETNSSHPHCQLICGVCDECVFCDCD